MTDEPRRSPDPGPAPEAPPATTDPGAAPPVGRPRGPTGGPPPAQEPPPRRRRGARWGRLLLLAVLLAGLAGALWVRRQLEPVASEARAIEFEVRPGWGAARVAAELEQAGLIHDDRVFRLYLRWRELDRSIGEGLYDLDPSLPAARIAERLAAGGRPRTNRVVIPEGWRLHDVAARLAAAGFGSEEELLALAIAPGELRPRWAPDGATLEGYLFPASYDLPVRMDAEAALGVMLDRFEAELTPEIVDAVAAAGLTVHEWVTLASVVQAEAGGSEEMPVIAGVFRNRLDLGMALQSDPTVAYGLGKALPELSAVAGDLQRDHPWNTYTRPGLPQGPIANPGREALRAVLEPVRQSADGRRYLYFLHGHDGGEIVFRPNASLREHNRDVRRFLR